MATKKKTKPELTKDEAQVAMVLLSRSSLGTNGQLENEIQAYANLRQKLQAIYSHEDG